MVVMYVTKISVTGELQLYTYHAGSCFVLWSLQGCIATQLSLAKQLQTIHTNKSFIKSRSAVLNSNRQVHACTIVVGVYWVQHLRDKHTYSQVDSFCKGHQFIVLKLVCFSIGTSLATYIHVAMQVYSLLTAWRYISLDYTHY